MKPKLLIVEDDLDIRSQMKWSLAEDYDVLLAETRSEALDICRAECPNVVLLDFGLPPHPADSTEGRAALSELLEQNRSSKVIVLTGQTEKENALNAIGNGAYDFLCKPVEIDELKIILKRAFHIAQLEHDYRQIQDRVNGDNFEDMLGGSAAMQSVFNSIRKVANSDASVLILGESGTGKEMAASAIHRRSARKEGPFVPINCGAIPEPLLESELFGHEKGAFTGAHMQRKGRIETANQGTLFLDEIGELPALLQVKLLRFLQEQRIERVGGRQQIQIDTRIVAATNVNLPAALKSGEFREDLYYRLAVVVISMPPLRNREDDVLLLAKAFLNRFAAHQGKDAPKLSQQAIRALLQHPWPGNVRELENRIKRAVIMADGNRITAADLELGDLGGNGSGQNLKQAREDLERDLVQQVLRKHGGKISPAATELGVSRPTFYDLMEKFGIRKE
jgi:two-component system NtrC family response regulator